MNSPGVLLDTGPLVALLSKTDAQHERATGIFGTCAPPFLSCEAVVTEACFLMRRVHPAGPAEVLALAMRGVFSIGLSAADHWSSLEALLKKYSDRPVSLADASLIQCATMHQERRIATFDSDFTVYLWGRNQKFEIL